MGLSFKELEGYIYIFKGSYNDLMICENMLYNLIMFLKAIEVSLKKFETFYRNLL